MGGQYSVLCKLCKKRNVKILFVGLDAAGKTTILYKLKLGEVVGTIPTVGFNVETIERGNINYTAWDVGASNIIWSTLRHYYQSTGAVIFVIDSRSRERYSEAVEKLQQTLFDDELRDVPVLILANKQDLSDVMTRDEILSDLMASNCLTGRKWEVFAVSGTLGEGLSEGLDWLTAVLSNEVPKPEELSNIEEENNDVDAIIKDVSKFSYYSRAIAAFKNLFV